MNSSPLYHFITSQFQGLEKASDQELWMKFWDSGGSLKPRKICHLCYSSLLLRCLTIDLKGTWIFFLMCCSPLLVKGSNLWLFSHFLLVQCAETKKKVVNRPYCVCVLCCFSHVQLFVTLWTVACQAPLSMGLSWQKYWSGLPFPPPGDLPSSVIQPAASALQVGYLSLSH